MNTKNLSATARMAAAALLLSIITTISPAAYAQGPTTPLGGEPPAPQPNCPEYRAAQAKADDLLTQAKVLTGSANYYDDQAKSIEKNVKADREALAAQSVAVERSKARIARLRSGEVYATNPAADIAREQDYLKNLETDLATLKNRVANEGEAMAKAIEYHHLADSLRAAAAKYVADADALLRSAAEKCSDTKDKKEKKDKSHGFRNGLFRVGFAIGTHYALGGRHAHDRDRERSDW
jgi:hypothetical protein